MSGKDDYLATGFRNVDSAKIDKMVRCLDALQSIECFQRYKNRSIELLQGTNNLGALDVACGLGDDAVRLKRKFGRVVGIDSSSALITEAIRRHQSVGCEFHCADATLLPFQDEEFDAARVDRALQHMEDPVRVVKEMTRVVKTGGTILCAEPDWGTFFIGTAFSARTKAIQDRWTESFRNPWIGRNLFGMMKSVGIGDLAIEAHLLLTEGFAASDLVFDLTKTIEELRSSGSAGAGLSDWLDNYKNTEALAGVMLFICHGSKV
jgi:ubiquinone/menaquinone biosynthesis C-methylase UbiE